MFKLQFSFLAYQERVENGVLVTFEESVKMSTYLTCFIVSDFQYINTTFGDDEKPLRVYTTPGQLEKATYALDIAKDVIEYFTEYFGIPFPLPKLGTSSEITNNIFLTHQIPRRFSSNS